MEIINLTSDTVTRPSKEMLEFMMQAPVGDDVFRADPTVNALEEKAADMFGHEAALFCPSGTMTNQIAIKAHTQPLDEVICHEYSHIYQYETGGYAYNSGVSVNLLQGPQGKINAEQIEKAIKPVYDWLPITKLVSLENTANKAGGSYYNLDEIKPITQLCKDKGLRLHLDGARLFNALAETKESTQDVGKCFDSISICLSKGLGAPVGSLLIGSTSFITQSRRYRKVMGGGMRQAGVIAAAGIYALDNNVERLQEDHRNAKILADALSESQYVGNIRYFGTNIIFFDVKDGFTGQSYLDALQKFGINSVPMGPQTVRFVTHLDITEEMINRVVDAIRKINVG